MRLGDLGTLANVYKKMIFVSLTKSMPNHMTEEVWHTCHIPSDVATEIGTVQGAFDALLPDAIYYQYGWFPDGDGQLKGHWKIVTTSQVCFSESSMPYNQMTFTVFTCQADYDLAFPNEA